MMKQNLNFYEKFYLVIFNSISRTNKSIPEWSTTFTISVLFFINLISIIILLNLSNLKGLADGIFQFGMLIIIILHWFYFLRQNRIIKKLKKVKHQITNSERILSGIYCLSSISLIYYVLNIGMNLYLITLGAFFVLFFLAYGFGGKPIEYN